MAQKKVVWSDGAVCRISLFSISCLNSHLLLVVDFVVVILGE